MRYFNYIEKKIHGGECFPVDYYRLDRHNPEYVMQLHWHLEYEIIRVTKGGLRLSIDGSTFALGAGTLCFIPSGALHGGTPEECEYECVNFSPDFVRSNCGGSFLDALVLHEIEIGPVISCSHGETETIARLLFDSLRKRERGWELTAMGTLISLFGAAINRGATYIPLAPGERYGGGLGQIKTALGVIEHRYAEQLSLEDLSMAAGVSPKYLCRIFRRYLDRTPMDYLNYFRVERACDMLVKNGATPTDAAFACGFNDCSHFIRVFKKYKGTTPGKYKGTTPGKYKGM